MHSQQMFNECIARHENNPREGACATILTTISSRYIVFPRLSNLDLKGVFVVVLPPNSGLGEGSGGHRIASSSGALRRI
jgi:hypothetical protein